MPLPLSEIQGRLSQRAAAIVSQTMGAGAARSPKPNKYHAKKVRYDGIPFDSQRECNHYQVLLALQKAGEIRTFARQCRFDLEAGVYYLLDFLVVWRDGSITYEDVKGVKTPVYALKKRQVEHRFAITITEI